MFSTPNLQTNPNTTGWLWFVILGVLLLLVIVWWLRSRRGEPLGAPTAQARSATERDDLTKIEGIGPKVANVLNDAGIATFAGLAQADAAEVQKALNAAGLRMMNPEGWIEQAQLAANGDWEGLARLQDELKGGRKR